MSDTVTQITKTLEELNENIGAVRETRVVVQVPTENAGVASEIIRNAGFNISSINEHSEGTSIYFYEPTLD